MAVIPPLVMDAVSAAAIAMLCLWYVATILNAVERIDGLIRRLGPLSTLVPSWNFFSPHPGQYDNYLFYRDRRIDGSLTDWRKVETFERTPRRLGWLWNPYIYRSKALFDVAQWLQREVLERTDGVDSDDTGPGDSGDASADDRPTAASDEPDAEGLPLDGASALEPVELGHVELSVLYLTVLHYVTNQEHSPLSRETQFMLMQHSRRTAHYEPLFVSNFHEL